MKRTVALAAMLTAGCAGEHLVWYGRSADREHVAAVLDLYGTQWVRRDGVDQKHYLGVGVESLAISCHGGHLLYPAQKKAGWVIVRDGVESEVWQGIGALVLTDDGAHVAYAAERGDAWTVIVDGQAAPWFEWIVDGSLSIAKTGRSAFIGVRGSDVRAVIDRIAGPAFEGVAGLSFDATGQHVVYIGWKGHTKQAVLDGVLGPNEEDIAAASLAPQGGSSIVVARRGRSWVSVFNGTPELPWDSIGPVTWSEDGKHHAYAARKGHEEFAVIDGVPSEPFEAVMPKGIALGRDGDRPIFAAKRADGWHVIRGTAGPAFDEVSAPIVDAQSRRWAYTGKSGNQSQAVIDGSLGPLFSWVGEVVFSRGGAHAGYIAGKGERTVVSIDGREHEADLAIDGSLVIDAKTGRFACLAGDAKTRTLFFWIDGEKRRPFDREELAAALLRAPLEKRMLGLPDPALVRDWAAAELETAISLAERRR